MAKRNQIEGITPLDSVEVEVDGETISVAPGSVTSVTTDVPHEADASSYPNQGEAPPLTRGAVSTNDPQHPIAHSLIAGAGAPQNPGPHPLVEGPHPDVAYVQPGDNVEAIDAPATGSAAARPGGAAAADEGSKAK